MFQSSSVVASWSTSRLVLFVSDHHDDSERIGKSSLATKSIVLWSNMTPICVITDITPEIFASFKIWLRIFGFSFFWQVFLESLAWRHHPLSIQRWKTAVLLARFRPLYMGVQFHCLLSECPLLLVWIFVREFQMWQCLKIFRIRYEWITSPTSASVQCVFWELSKKDVCWRTRPWLGLLQTEE